MSSVKLIFHVKKLSAALGTVDSDPASLDQIIKSLILNYREYELVPSNELRTEVKKIIESTIAEKQVVVNAHLSYVSY